MAVPRVLVEIAASIGRFEANFGDAVKIAERNSKRINDAISKTKALLASLGVAVSAGAFVNLIRGTIDAADHLNDLSKATGVSVETLGGLGFAASQAGTDLDGVGKAFSKFNLRVAEATAGNEEAIGVFKAIGISLNDLKTLSPDQIFIKVADAFASYEDGANKAAIGNALFKKDYQSIIPLLDEGGGKIQQNIDYFRKYGGVTAETAKQADEFNDTLVKIKLLSGQFQRNIASELLPSLQSLADEFVATKEKGDGFKGAARDIAEILKGTASAAAATATGISAFGHALGENAAIVAAVLRGEFSLVSKIHAEAVADQDARFANLQRLLNAINNPQSSASKAVGDGSPVKKRPAPSLPGKDAEDAAKKILEGQLKALEDSIRDEQDTLKDREHFLQVYYDADLLGIKEFYDARRTVIDEATQNELEAIDKEIDALRAHAARASTSANDRQDDENKIAEAITRRAKLERERSVRFVDLTLQETNALKEFKTSLQQLAQELAQLNGDSVTAGLLAFDLQHDREQKKIDRLKESNDAEERRLGSIGQQQLNDARTRTAQQLALNKAQSDFGDITNAIGISQQRIDLLQQTGAITELEALRLRSESAKDYIARLSELAAVAQDKAVETGLLKDKNAAEQLRLELDRLIAQGGEFAKKFNDIFANDALNALDEFTDGTKKAKDAAKDLLHSLQHDLGHEINKVLIQSLLGKDGPLSGIGGFFASLFGGSAGNAAAGASLSGLSVAATTTTSTFVALSAAATAAAAALGATAAASGANAAASLGPALAGVFPLSGLPAGGFAAGGNPPLNVPSLVGERGPELIVPRNPVTVIPHNILQFAAAKAAHQSPTIHVGPINVLPGADTRTADQVAAATVRQLQAAFG